MSNLALQIGFHIIDAIADRHNMPLTAMQSRAVVGKGRIEGVPILLAKPQTYMNLSGESVSDGGWGGRVGRGEGL